MPLWSNWAGEQRCAPARIERPASEAELAAAIARASEGGERVRIVGSGHSFTDIACTDGVMIDLARMSRVLSADTATGVVTVEAGITLHELGKELAARGLAMENQGDIDAQTLAGAISTATHGTGGRFANISSQVAGVRLVTAGGDVLDIDAETDPEALLAARVGLGALGAISAVTLRCVPLFTIERVDEPRALEATLEGVDEHVDGADHFEFFVFPHTDVALTRTSTRSDRAPEPGNPRVEIIQERLLENGAVGLLGALSRRAPRAIPRANRLLVKGMSRTVKVDRSHRVYATVRSVRFTEMEYAVPREHCAEAVRRVLSLIERRGLDVAFPIEVRVVAGDDAFLSTAHGHDTAYIAVHQFRGMEFETYFRAVEDALLELGGRPHWGKRHYLGAETLRERYPDWERFAAVRRRLDPAGLFENAYLRRVLGPVAP